MQKKILAYIVLIAIIFGFLGYFSSIVIYKNIKYYPVLPAEGKSTIIPLLAVDENGKGTVIPLVVGLKPGSGKIWMNIDNPSFILDTQDSMRLAVEEAADMSGVDINEYDVTFSLETNVSVVGGPSAGAAITLATLSLLLNKQLEDDVAITGTIEEGGYIGQVGGIGQKAAAAKKAGIRLLLVPPGESFLREPFETCTQQKTGSWSRKECFITYKTVNISRDVGIEVKEVSTIREAMEYLFR